ncbi:FkbM family methyltransferase [Agrobacterium rosae]|uniref:FkbM family methyltransferase n=1 Tax=Agrobacterium rosae TaxID=1972867 RepID=UPI003A80A81E
MRIGGDGDGGYLIPNDLDGIEFCFSPGVSEIAHFEEHLARDYSVKSFMADASVENPPIKGDFFSFEKKFLGTKNSQDFMRLESWLDAKQDQIGTTDLILQMDIEGAEYDVLIDTSSDALRRFRIIVIEFHKLDMIFDRSSLQLLRPIIEKLTNDFVVAHLHPNNYRPFSSNHSIKIPNVLEVTFLRKDRIHDHAEKDVALPHYLDRPNLKEKVDLKMPEIWWNS